jgi:ankyrin repeat protein
MPRYCRLKHESPLFGCILNLPLLRLSLSPFKVVPKVDKDLHKNAAEGNLDLVIEILKSGTDINLKDAFGLTALTWAIRNGKLETGESLHPFTL